MNPTKTAMVIALVAGVLLLIPIVFCAGLLLFTTGGSEAAAPYEVHYSGPVRQEHGFETSVSEPRRSNTRIIINGKEVRTNSSNSVRLRVHQP